MPAGSTFKSILGAFRNDTPVAARCPHFGTCGGCSFQDVPYETQVMWKEAALSELFGRHVPVIPSPAPYEYRTRMDFVVAFGNIGLRPRGRHNEVIELEHCHLITGKANKILREVRRLRRELGIADYDYLRHTGFLRYAVLRQAGTGDVMLILVTRKPLDGEGDLLCSMAERLSEMEECSSVWWVVHDGLSDLSYGEPRQFWRNEFLRERLGTVEYLIGPNTFFQSNLQMALECFNAIKSATGEGSVLDLYCGTGAISLFIHGRSLEITGVEENAESTALAQRNMALNDIHNARFIASDVRQFLISNGQRFDTVILDPPRSGAGRKVMKRINALGARRIIYMACNPDTFREDSVFLDGYSLEIMSGFDMFPHTPHVELVAVFDAIRPAGA